MACPTGSRAEALSREKIDGWLQHLGASDKFDASKGIDWGVMPGPFYTPELGLGIGTALSSACIVPTRRIPPARTRP
ncbi:hypothetical protein FZ928_21325 [Klebsiella pneumoniae]|uniref:Uncharacterized protein n=1 Tax=Klebsiella pneumoniae TaxID=573 RepID=A0A5C2LL61_KLEPN|nr:hypothetical protein FZ928_21325 [Klebsiella pneumoniae]